MATWQKLKDGSWGVRVAGSAKAGESVRVTKKSGESQEVVISRVVWSGDGVTLCSVGQASSTGTSRSTSRHRGGCKGCGGAIVNAPHHRAMDGYCGDCAFDEFDM